MSPVIAAIILIVVAITLAMAVGAWIYGVYWQGSKTEIYLPLTIRLDTPHTVIQQPVKGYLMISAWSDPVGHHKFKVVISITAIKDLSHLRIHATIVNRTGQTPVDVANTGVTWEYSNLPEGWYTSQYWTPIDRIEYPVTITLSIYFREG